MILLGPGSEGGRELPISRSLTCLHLTRSFCAKRTLTDSRPGDVGTIGGIPQPLTSNAQALATSHFSPPSGEVLVIPLSPASLQHIPTSSRGVKCHKEFRFCL